MATKPLVQISTASTSMFGHRGLAYTFKCVEAEDAAALSFILYAITIIWRSSEHCVSEMSSAETDHDSR